MYERVGELLRETAARIVLPGYGRLEPADVRSKAGGDLVTTVDDRAEAALTVGLAALLPGATVVGEEAVAARPALLRALAAPGPAWVVDPVDGTANYVAGSGPFLMLVALRRGGVTEASWLYDPRADELWHAVHGGGAYRNGRAVAVAARPAAPDRGAVSARSVPERVIARARRAGSAELLPGLRCAGREYPDIVTGVQDFALFWRTKPWDHLPGALLLAEAGGAVAHLNGEPYTPTTRYRGLLAAASRAGWDRLAAALRPPS
ncbi:inositol monophosphatase [Pilimelia anulata]|uniref:Inositol monophosphatase n=1 Tax=Pilimelia anulata TaxID=53371 RepID=A0A8J3B954_9ACTN|nr:inositol monophosphatase family protein [Pilimelia anulata]GGJ98080.1 inositol monophosphatase [Pilimelia anulata]